MCSSSQARHGVVSGSLAQTTYMLILTGVEYGADDVFDLSKMEPFNLDKLYQSFTKYSNEVVLYLPRNSDLNQVARYAKEGKKLEVAHYAIMGASKVCHSFASYLSNI